MRMLVYLLAIFVTLLTPNMVAVEPEEGSSPILAQTEPPELATTDRLPGVDLAEAITSVTGVAISPLLGVSAVGAWHYVRTAPELRGELPWFCHPLAWGLGLTVLVLCALKDVVGTTTPALLKKPIDVAELFENKASGMLVCATFVPFVADQVVRHFGDSTLGANAAATASAGAGLGGEGILLASTSLAMIDSGWGLWLLLLPVLLAGFLVVWLLGHTVNVLVLLSPFGILDTGLKACRVALMSAILILSAIHPVIGAIFCLMLIAVAAILAPWAFRLAVFGTVMGGDLARSVFLRSKVPEGRVFGFLAHQNGDRFRVRCGGWLTRNELGEVIFETRRAFFGPVGRFRLATTGRFGLRRGLLFPSAYGRDDSGQAARPMVLLLPRYRVHLDGIASDFQVVAIDDSLIQRGLKGAIAWVRETAQLGRKSAMGLLERRADGGTKSIETATP